MQFDVVIVGGGHGGAQAAIALRQNKFEGSIAVVGDEPELPYEPCAIMEAGDDAAALEDSLIENIARLHPDEVTRWETFTRLIREGRSPEDIALTFGLAEVEVKRTLAPGNLLPRNHQAKAGPSARLLGSLAFARSRCVPGPGSGRPAAGQEIKLDLDHMIAKRPYIVALDAAAAPVRLKVLAEQERANDSVPGFYLDTAEWFRL